MRSQYTQLLLLVVPIFLLALPSGEEIHKGDARFERHGETLTIHANDGCILHYRDFHIGQTEAVEFVQPDSKARVLNRVFSSVPSQIDGKLRANGQVYLVNPQGIVFGPQAIVDANRFFAAAAQIRDADFFAQNETFFNLSGPIVNQGLLKGEAVHLIGAQVDNFGCIEAPEGCATLLSGRSVLICEKEGHCFVALDPGITEGIGAADLVGLAIRTSGFIKAKTVHVEGERVDIDGVISAPDGSVTILGDTISLQRCNIDAKGASSDGGIVRIGGDFQGGGDLRRSKKTEMLEDAVIDVSANEHGNGGTAILSSDGTTIFDGLILARGGKQSGNGGLIETSGKKALGCQNGRTDATAVSGRIGDWLLDPLSITIASSGAGTLIQAADCTDVMTALTIQNTTIDAALANVVLCASTTITQNSDAPIHITASGVGITYQAASSTTLNSNVTTNGGAITATTSSTTLSGATLSSGSGNISLLDVLIGVGGTGSTIQVGSGTLTLSGTTTLNNNLTLTSSGGMVSTGNITGASKNLTIDGGASATVSIGGNLSVDTLTVTNSSSTTIVGTTSANSVILTNTTGNIDFVLAATIGSISTTTGAYSVTFESGGTITSLATFSNTGGVSFGTSMTAGNITFTNGLNTNQTGVTTSVNGTVATTASAMSLGPTVLLGTTTMNTSNGALTFNETLTGAYNLTVNTGTTAPIFTGAVSIGDEVGNTSLTISTTGTSTLFSNTLTTVGGFTSNNNVVFNNNVSIGGAVSLPSLTTNVAPLASYNVSFLGGGTVTALTQFFNTGTVTFGSSSHPTLNFTNGVSTLNGPTSTTVQGTVQVATASAPLTFGPTIFGTGNDALTTNNGAISIGNTTLTGNATLTSGGGNITTGTVNGAGNFTTTSGSSGATTIDALTCGTFTPSNSASVTVTGATAASTVNLVGMSNSQAVTFNGLVAISTNLFTSGASYSVAFNAGGTVTPLTNFFNTGGVILGNSSSSTITFTNGVNTNYTSVTTQTAGLIQATSGPISLGPVTLNGNTTVRATSSPILFASTINGGFSLSAIDSEAAVTFSGIVGGTTPLYSLYASGSLINIGANMTASGNSITFASPVVLLATVTLTDTGSGISFASTIDGAFGLALNASNAGSVTVNGAVGGSTALTALTVNAAKTASFNSTINTTGASGSNGGNISIAAGGNIGCGGNITAIGGANGFNGGSVTLSSSGGSISVASIDVSGGAGGGFAGGNAGSITLQPGIGYSHSSKLGNNPNGILSIYGSLTALGGSGTTSGSSGTVSLSPAGRSTTMSIATIIGNPAGSNLTINGGDLLIGPNEAMTILGNIAFNLQNTAAVGDLVALQSIAINAATVNLILHQPGEILDNQGILYPNSALHIISGDPTLNGSIVYSGSGNSLRIRALNTSPAEFRPLLFYGGTVLNFDRDFAPISGIIDWVLRTDFWDTQPLIRFPSRRQLLAIHINRTLDLMPQLQPVWLSLQKRKGNPVEAAIQKYQADRDLQTAMISVPEFQSFLKHPEFKGAHAYLSSIKTLLTGVKQQVSWRGSSDLFTGFTPVKRAAEAGSRPIQFLADDVLEFTKPTSLTLQQWRSLVLGHL